MSTQLKNIKHLLMSASQLLLFLSTVSVYIQEGHAGPGCSSSCKLCTNGTCEECPVGRYLGDTGDRKECLPCPSDCKLCADMTLCKECYTGYWLAGKNYCKPCPMNCKSCLSTRYCNSCNDGWFGRECRKVCQGCARCNLTSGECIHESILIVKTEGVQTQNHTFTHNAASNYTVDCDRTMIIYVTVGAGVIVIVIILVLIVSMLSYRRSRTNASGTNRSTQTDEQAEMLITDYMDLTCRQVSTDEEHRYSVVDKYVTSECAATPVTMPAFHDSAKSPNLYGNTCDTWERQARAVTCVNTKGRGQATYINV